jgi:hypothetical protein
MKSRCHQGHALSEFVQENPFLSLLSSSSGHSKVPWLVATLLSSMPLCVVTVQISLFLQGYQ